MVNYTVKEDFIEKQEMNFGLNEWAGLLRKEIMREFQVEETHRKRMQEIYLEPMGGRVRLDRSVEGTECSV